MDKLPFFGTLDWMFDSLEFLEEHPSIASIYSDICDHSLASISSYKSTSHTSELSPILDEEKKDWITVQEIARPKPRMISEFLTLSNTEEHKYFISAANFALHLHNHSDRYEFISLAARICDGQYVHRLYLRRKQLKSLT